MGKDEKGKMKRGQKRLAPDELLTPKEIEAMLLAAGSLRNKAFIACLYETGVRKHELAALKLKHVKPTNGHYTFWFGKVKVTGEEHEGFIIEAAAILRAWLEVHPWKDNPEAALFCTWNGNHMGGDTVWHVITNAARHAGIQKRVFPHLLRHSRATHLLQLGVPEAQLKALLGWVPGSSMLSRYSHLTSRTAKNAYLKALGKEPEQVAVERVNFEEPTLGAIKPMIRPPAGPPEPRTPTGIDAEGHIFDSKLLMKEAVAEALADVIRSGKLEELLRMAGKVTA